MKKLDDQQVDNDPRLVALCLGCKKRKCTGSCDEYSRVRREVSPFTGKKKYTGRTYEMDGKKLTISQWASEYGICDNTLRKRLERGMPLEKALKSYYERAKKRG